MDEIPQSGYNILVSTSAALIRLDVAGLCPAGSPQPAATLVDTGHGLYYGLARNHREHIWVAARHALVSDHTPTWDERGKLIDITAHPSPLAVAPSKPLRDLHGIALHNNTLWCACSFDDVIAICTIPEKEWTWWQPLPIDPVAGPDQFHFNTLVIEDELVWVLAHRRGPSWLLAFPIDVAMKGETVDPVRKIELGQQAHNMWRQPDGELCTCSSIEGMLLGEHGWRLETGGFPRGVAKISDGWVVGISELKERSARDFSDARLRFYDSNWETTGEFTLPGVGMVLDILPIPRSLPLPVVGTQPVFAN